MTSKIVVNIQAPQFFMDIILLRSLKVQTNGGSGTDTLTLAANFNLDLTTLSNNKISGIEVVNITGTGNNTLTLNIHDMLDASDTSNIFKVIGDAGDAVVANLTGLGYQ